MPGLTLLALLVAAPAQETPSFERMLQCDAYREIWQWDEHEAGRKVPEDNDWYGPFRDRLRAAGAAQGLDRHRISELYNARVQARPKLTAEQNADWAKCQAEIGWKPDASGRTIN